MGEHDIGRLDVSVRNSSRMRVLKRKQDLFHRLDTV